jgi:integrase
MSESHSTAPTNPGKPTKPVKPYPEFPLTAHPAGYWCKKIRGKLHYFGPWDDPDGALKKYLEQKDALHAGRKPRADAGGLTVKELCNHFLTAKQALVDGGELSPRTGEGYKRACVEVVAAFGKGRLVSDLGPGDFASLRKRLAKRYGVHGLGTQIQCVRCCFKHAYDADLSDRPVRFGPGLKRPSKETLRLHKAKQGPKRFAAEEVHSLLAAAGPVMKAMLLLGINAGFGNADCGNLPRAAVDLEHAIIDYPRPKKGIPRRCPLWPETVEALKEALARRPEPKNPQHAGLVFVTQRGRSWAKDTNDCPVAKETAKLLKQRGINGRQGLGFYTLRHTFRTIAGEAKDQPAADCIMGHEVPHLSAVYRETISDARLKAVTQHVHDWLFPPHKEKPARKEAGVEGGAEE